MRLKIKRAVALVCIIGMTLLLGSAFAEEESMVKIEAVAAEDEEGGSQDAEVLDTENVAPRSERVSDYGSVRGVQDVVEGSGKGLDLVVNTVDKVGSGIIAFPIEAIQKIGGKRSGGENAKEKSEAKGEETAKESQ